jgi:hypothetical protein
MAQGSVVSERTAAAATAAEADKARARSLEKSEAQLKAAGDEMQADLSKLVRLSCLCAPTMEMLYTNDP